jgi:hypothetical protein
MCKVAQSKDRHCSDVLPEGTRQTPQRRQHREAGDRRSLHIFHHKQNKKDGDRSGNKCNQENLAQCQCAEETERDKWSDDRA